MTAYGLAVEHYQKNEVVWSGQGGTGIFFQNELPYDVPSQSAWMATPSQDGYPAFLVTPNVKSFTGYGLGSYSFFNTGVAIQDAMAFQAPDPGGNTQRWMGVPATRPRISSKIMCCPRWIGSSRPRARPYKGGPEQ